MLWKRNDDVTNGALFTGVLQRAKKFYARSVPLCQGSTRSARGTCLHSGIESRNLSAIGATKRGYSQLISNTTATSRNASKIPSLITRSIDVH